LAMSKILKKLLSFKFFLLALSVNAQIASKDLSFRAIGIQDGLSSYTVRKVIQDRYGFTWIATKDGLNRFDGKSFKIYNKSLKGSEDIKGNDFRDMCEDTLRNLLWSISAYGGLNAIDISKGNVVLGVLATPKNFPNNWLRCLNICEKKIWIGTDDGICVFDPYKNAFIHVEKIPFRRTGAIQNYSVDLIFVDQFERVWVFVKNLGVVVYSGKNYKIIETHILPEFHLKAVPEFQVFKSCLLVDSSNLLLATNNGFRKVTYSNKKIISISDAEIIPKNFVDVNIISLGKDANGDIWFATASNLFSYNLRTKKILQVQSLISGTKTAFFDYIQSISIKKIICG
jgi:ligand-binding sensor domain-containing protein